MKKRFLSVIVLSAALLSVQAQEGKGGISPEMLGQIKQSYQGTAADKAPVPVPDSGKAQGGQAEGPLPLRLRQGRRPAGRAAGRASEDSRQEERAACGGADRQGRRDDKKRVRPKRPYLLT